MLHFSNCKYINRAMGREITLLYYILYILIKKHECIFKKKNLQTIYWRYLINGDLFILCCKGLDMILTQLVQHCVLSSPVSE